MGRARLTAADLSTLELRHVANHVWGALANGEWVKYTRDLTGGDGGKFRTFGGGRFRRVEPSTTLEGRGLPLVALPEPLLGLTEGLAVYLEGRAWDEYLAGLPLELRGAVQAALGEGPRAKAPFVRQATAAGYSLRRNSGRGVTRELAAVACEAVGLCELARLTWEEGEELLAGSTAVLEGLQNVTAA